MKKIITLSVLLNPLGEITSNRHFEWNFCSEV